MAITPARQRNAISEGMALGLLMCDHHALLWDKTGIDLSFEGAWRSWQHRRRFPQVDTDLRQGLDGVWAMTRAGERKHTFSPHWDADGPEITVCPRSAWPDGAVDLDQAAKLIDGDVRLPAGESWPRISSGASRSEPGATGSAACGGAPRSVSRR